MRGGLGWLTRASPDWAVLLGRYYRCHGALPRILRPRTLNEKVFRRVLFDRSAWIAAAADKYAVRDFVRERLGPDVLPELYCVTTEPETIPFAALPDRFVVKPTHGSQWVEIVRDKSRLDAAALRRTCSDWLGKSYYEISREWGYKHVTPRILVEELIDDGNGLTPHDYKLYVFNGRVEMIGVMMGRFEARGHGVVDRGWKPVDVTFEFSATRSVVPPPPHLDQMVEAAETLARGLDFVRVDFYDTPDKLVFGELTATPGCGLSPYMPPSSDRHLGSLWKSYARPNSPRVGRLPAELPRAPGDDDGSQLPRGPDVGGRR